MPDVIIPVRIRTARTGYTCGQCHKPILPGEKYEDHRLPPHRDVNDDAHWWPMKIHAPRVRNGYHNYGCEISAAYRERARRMRAVAMALSSAPIGADLDLLECATRAVVAAQKADPNLVQRRVRVGFAKAGRLLLLLQDYGVIGPMEGGRRDVLVPPWDLGNALADLRACSELEASHA